MIYQLSDNIISSLEFSTEENYVAVKQGISGLKFYEKAFDLFGAVKGSGAQEIK